MTIAEIKEYAKNEGGVPREPCVKRIVQSLYTQRSQHEHNKPRVTL